nr:hypothetical protein GCM10025699_34620 [Microbacterium flavescens]
MLDSNHTAAELRASVEAVRDARAAADRAGDHDFVAYVITAFGPDAESRALADVGDKPDPQDRAVWGDPAEVATALGAFFDTGVDDVVLLPASRVDLADFYASAAEVSRLVTERAA